MTMHDRALAMADKHRSWLERTELVGDGTCIWNGLNPSTAGADVNDPTITREIGFTRRLGCRQMIKLNLFTGRATKPENLWKIDDPVGPGADEALERALGEIAIGMLGSQNDRFIAAWGTRPNGGPLWFKEMYAKRVRHTLRVAQAFGVQVWCLGYTDDASPRHPLYVRADAPLVPFVYGGQL